MASSRPEEAPSRNNVPLRPAPYLYRLDLDPHELEPGSLPDDLILPTSQVFSATAGRFIPGLQILVAGVRGPSSVVLEIPVAAEIAQAWSVGKIHSNREGSVTKIDITEGHPFATFSLNFRDELSWIKPKSSSTVWVGLDQETQVAYAATPSEPKIERIGAYLWRNPEGSERESFEHKKLLEVLRGLGYLN